MGDKGGQKDKNKGQKQRSDETTGAHARRQTPACREAGQQQRDEEGQAGQPGHPTHDRLLQRLKPGQTVQPGRLESGERRAEALGGEGCAVVQLQLRRQEAEKLGREARLRQQS